MASPFSIYYGLSTIISLLYQLITLTTAQGDKLLQTQVK